MLAQRQDPAALEALWRRLPEADRHVPEIALEGARMLNLAGRGQLAAEVIETALGKSPAAWDDVAERLLDEYARAQSFPARHQLERAEGWLAQVPARGAIRAALLRTAGLVCLREQLWGKVEGLPAGQPRGSEASRDLSGARAIGRGGRRRAGGGSPDREAALGFAQLPSAHPESAMVGLRSGVREIAH